MNRDNQIELADSTPVLKEDKQPIAANLAQTGDENTQIAYVQNYDGSVHQTFNINIQQTKIAENEEEKKFNQRHSSRNYYQLIVTHDKDIFKNNIFSIPNSIPWERVLTQERVPKEIYSRFSELELFEIEELLSFPAIICNENNGYNGKIDTPQTAYFCHIKRIQEINNQIRVLFEPINSFDQAILCDKQNAVYFDLDMDEFFTTLNQTAWSIHRADVFEAFKEAGIDYIDEE